MRQKMDHKNLIMYAHGSAYNHGCEAIVRASADILSLERDKTLLFSNNVWGDLDFGMYQIADILPVRETPVGHTSPLGYLYRVRAHMHRDPTRHYYRIFGQRQYAYLYGHADTALSIGGDNYCYPSALTALEVRNYWLNKKGTKTILWGASLTEDLLSPAVMEDLNRYSLITVRERLSYDMLKAHNIATDVVLAPDPAFALAVEDTPWPDGKEHPNVVGINTSHFVSQLSASANSGIRNYINLINWILNETDMEIAFIPHVVFPEDPGNNDLLDIQKLMELLPASDRIMVLDGTYNCCQLKSLISKCRFFVGARTHATIAAYSTGVPTLVVGYSTKSIGIARDLFGTEAGYVCSVQNMTDDNMLLSAFQNIVLRESELRRHLASFIPAYRRGHQACVEAVNAYIR